MHWHSVDYKARGGDVKSALVNRGFWAHLPRLMIVCRLLGHDPAVDGTAGFNGRPGHRWACCDRCGIRPEPQGSLDPSVWAAGDRIELDAPIVGATMQPGSWPSSPEGVIGGQLIVGGRVTAGASVKVGNAGSEHVLAASARIPFIGGLYLHTEGFGTWIQRRLNPAGYESRVISFDVHGGRAYWKAWAPRDEHLKGPRWRDGSVRIDPRDIFLGERRYSYTDASGDEAAVLLMPNRAEYEITMKLQRQTLGRTRGRKRESWTADCDSESEIPYRQSWKGGLCGWSVPVSSRAVEAGEWQQEAIAATISKITEMRIRYGYKTAPQNEGIEP
jgi:hypothetical protein